MKILGISCSPRKGMATHKALEHCLQAVRDAHPDIETDSIELADFVVRGCTACGTCLEDIDRWLSPD